MDVIVSSNYLAAIIGVFSLIFVMFYIIKKTRNIKINPSKDMTVLKTIHLGSKEKIMLVEVENTRVLLGITPTNINSLLELKDENSCADKVENIQRFSAVSEKG